MRAAASCQVWAVALPAVAWPLHHVLDRCIPTLCEGRTCQLWPSAATMLPVRSDFVLSTSSQQLSLRRCSSSRCDDGAAICTADESIPALLKDRWQLSQPGVITVLETQHFLQMFTCAWCLCPCRHLPPGSSLQCPSRTPSHIAAACQAWAAAAALSSQPTWWEHSSWGTRLRRSPSSSRQQ